MVARDGTTKYVSCSFSFLFSNKRKTNRNLLLFSSSTDFIEATGGANRFIGWRRLVARFQMVEWRMAGGSFYFRIAQIWMRIVLGWQCLRSWPAIGQQFALFWIAPFHASVLEPYFHLRILEAQFLGQFFAFRLGNVFLNLETAFQAAALQFGKHCPSHHSSTGSRPVGGVVSWTSTASAGRGGRSQVDDIEIVVRRWLIQSRRRWRMLLDHRRIVDGIGHLIGNTSGRCGGRLEPRIRRRRTRQIRRVLTGRNIRI